jgi:hypothetical protein
MLFMSNKKENCKVFGVACLRNLKANENLKGGFEKPLNIWSNI